MKVEAQFLASVAQFMSERDTLTSTYELCTHTHACANRRQNLKVCNRLILKTWREDELKGEEREPGLWGQTPSSATSRHVTLGRSCDSLSPSSPNYDTEVTTLPYRV